MKIIIKNNYYCHSFYDDDDEMLNKYDCFIVVVINHK